MARSEVSVIIRARDLATSVLNRFRRSLRSLGDMARTVVRGIGALTAAAGGLVVALTKVTQRGEAVTAVQRAFGRMNDDAAKSLERLRQASNGTIADFELMRLQNTAMALGAAKSNEEFAEMVRLSRALGRAQGLDATEALDKFTIALARQSKLRADDLGLMIDIEASQESYARSLGKTTAELNDAEKAEAFRVEMMRQARDLVDELGDAQGTAADSAGRFAASMANLRDRFAEVVSQSPLVNEFFERMTNFAEDLIDVMGGSAGTIANGFAVLGRVAGNAFAGAFLLAVAGMMESLDNLIGSLLDKIPGFKMSDAERQRLVDQGFITTDATTRLGQLADFLEQQAQDPFSQIAPLLEELQGLSLQGRIERRNRMNAAIGGGAGGAVAGGGGAGGGGVGVGLFAGVPMAGLTAPVFAPSPAMQRQQFPVSPLLAGGMTLTPSFKDTGVPEAVDEFDQAGRVAVASFGAMAEAAIIGSENMAQAVISGFQRILSATDFGGSLFGGILGAGLGIVGTLFGRRNRDPVPVRMEDVSDRAAQRLKDARNGPERITTIIESGGREIERIERNLYDRQNRDEVVRYSRGGALGGGR